jgi:hypothetical protein
MNRFELKINNQIAPSLKMKCNNFYPFFMDCYQRESDVIKRAYLHKLAFGLGGLIFKRDNDDYLCVSTGEFKIPKAYSIKEYARLKLMIWDTSSDYHAMQEQIKLSKPLLSGVKKKDRLRLIDQYVLRHVNALSKARRVKYVIILAAILKIISALSIVYRDGEIYSIEDASSEADILNAFNSTYFMHKEIKPNGKYTDKEKRVRVNGKKSAGKSSTISEDEMDD